MQWFWRRNPQPLALPDGIVGKAAMATQGIATEIVDRPRPGQTNQRLCARGYPSYPGYPSHTGSYQFGTFSICVGGIPIDEAAIVVLRNKANLLALGFCSDCHAPFSRHSAYLRLSELSQGKAGVCKLLLVENVQDVGLILIRINTTPQTPF